MYSSDYSCYRYLIKFLTGHLLHKYFNVENKIPLSLKTSEVITWQNTYHYVEELLFRDIVNV